MKYPLATSPHYQPAPLVNVSDYNPHVFRLGTLSKDHCLRLINRMKTGAPDLYNTLHHDPFVKALITNFDADVIIPMKKKQ